MASDRIQFYQSKGGTETSLSAEENNMQPGRKVVVHVCNL